MSTQPYMVWHDETAVDQERVLGIEGTGNLTRRYIVHASSAEMAARWVDETKAEQGRLLPDVYNVCRLRHGQDGEVIELLEDGQTDLDYEVEQFERLFGEPAQVRLPR